MTEVSFSLKKKKSLRGQSIILGSYIPEARKQAKTPPAPATPHPMPPKKLHSTTLL